MTIPRPERVKDVVLWALVLLAAAGCRNVPDDSPNKDQRRAIERLSSLGYLAGVVAGPPGSGVVLHDSDLAHQRLNLYNVGSAPEAILMDMNGEVLHRWRMPYEVAFPERAAEAEQKSPGASKWSLWRRVYLYPNGDLLAIFEGRGGLIKIDKESRLIWAVTNGAHHEVTVADNGQIYVLTRTAHLIPEINPDQPILEDFVTVLDTDGRELRRTSILDAVLSSDFAYLLGRSPMRGDIMHTNTLKLLDDDDALPGSPVFRAGNVLTSFRHLDAIAVIDLEVNRVVWALKGLTEGQHDPTLLPNGHILMFDNRRSEDPGSRVIEIDPATEEIRWQYPEGAPGLYSECCGTSQRLANGNTLITYSGPGIAREVTPAGRVVWEFQSLHRTGANDELIAQLMEVRRLPLGFARDWLAK